jgi:uncharacterized protein YkwD
MTNKVLRIIFFLGIALSGYWATTWPTAYALARPEGPPPFPPTREAVVEDQAAVAYAEGAYLLYLPVAHAPVKWFDTANREESRLLFQEEYEGTEGVDPGWTGGYATCDAGATSEAFRAATLRRINYFRTMAGVPKIIGFDDAYNVKAQAAALMMSVNGELNHTPDPVWKCYTEAGYEGASSSNLAMDDGVDAIQAYMEDYGGGNFFVGHRRWILYPQTQKMGTGDIPSSPNYPASNALWVFDHEHMWAPRPATREEFVAWPPPGFVPEPVVFPRWSLAYPEADFSLAAVSMTHAGQAIEVQMNPLLDGFGDNTLVWEPRMPNFPSPGSDASYQVSVRNVIVEGQARTFNYTVIVFYP